MSHEFEKITVEMDNEKTKTTQDKYMGYSLNTNTINFLPNQPNAGYNRELRRDHPYVLVKSSPYQNLVLQKGSSI